VIFQHLGKPFADVSHTLQGIATVPSYNRKLHCNFFYIHTKSFLTTLEKQRFVWESTFINLFEFVHSLSIGVTAELFNLLEVRT
jgi:hypothetical protein